MALTITVSEVAVAVRVATDPLSGPDEPYLTEIVRQLAVADAMITGYADDAPDAVKNEAAARIVGYLLEAPAVNPSRNVSTPEGVFRNSGAKALLAGWHNLVSEAVGNG